MLVDLPTVVVDNLSLSVEKKAGRKILTAVCETVVLWRRVRNRLNMLGHHWYFFFFIIIDLIFFAIPDLIASSSFARELRSTFVSCV